VLLGITFQNLQVEVQRDSFVLSLFLFNGPALQMRGYISMVLLIIITHSQRKTEWARPGTSVVKNSNPAVSVKSVTFRPCLNTGLALTMNVT
jgi:hypothetical protein